MIVGFTVWSRRVIDVLGMSMSCGLVAMERFRLEMVFSSFFYLQVVLFVLYRQLIDYQGRRLLSHQLCTFSFFRYVYCFLVHE